MKQLTKKDIDTFIDDNNILIRSIFIRNSIYSYFYTLSLDSGEDLEIVSEKLTDIGMYHTCEGNEIDFFINK